MFKENNLKGLKDILCFLKGKDSIVYRVLVACIINSLQFWNDASRILTDNSRVMLQIVASLIDNYRGVIYNNRGIIKTRTGVTYDVCNMLTAHAQATGGSICLC